MKKLIFLIATMSAFSSAYADVDSILVKKNIDKVSPNDTFYISSFIIDENKQPLSGLQLSISGDGDKVKIGNTYDCVTAEGREQCLKFSQNLVGLKGGYVTEVTAISSGEANINVTISGTNRIGNLSFNIRGEDIPSEGVTTQPVVEKELNAAPVTGGEIQGKQYIMILFFILVLLAVNNKSFRNKYVRKYD